MRFYNIEMKGKLFVEKRTSLPVHDPKDEGRLFYYNNNLYYSGAAQNVLLDAGGGGGTMASQDASAVAITGGTIEGVELTLAEPNLADPILNGDISGNAFLDEDNMVSNSDTKVASQQSIKAYIDSGVVTMSNKTLMNPKINEDVVLSSTATQLDATVNKRGVFVADVDSPTINNITLTTSVLLETYQSIGPTGSGADVIWTALNTLPTDINWIEIRVLMIMHNREQDFGPQFQSILELRARRLGSSVDGNSNTIGHLRMVNNHQNSGGGLYQGTETSGINYPKIGVNGRQFEMRYIKSNIWSTTIIIHLVGYGWNP
jgi:hypothetical protein